jgi:hypothetical protein
MSHDWEFAVSPDLLDLPGDLLRGQCRYLEADAKCVLAAVAATFSPADQFLLSSQSLLSRFE